MLDIGFCLLAIVMEDLKALTLRATLLEGVLQIDSVLTSIFLRGWLQIGGVTCLLFFL